MGVNPISRGYKIKRNNDRIYRRGNRNRSHSPLGIAGVVAAALALFVVGWLVYTPVYNLITGNTTLKPDSQPQEPPSQPQSEPTQPSGDSEPSEPAGSAVPADVLRAVYAPPELMRDAGKLEALVKSASQAGYNALLFDVKDERGMIQYQTANETAAYSGALAEQPFNLTEVTALIRAGGMQSVARMHVFQDSRAPRGYWDMAIRVEDGRMWMDADPQQGGEPWLNPYAAMAQDYHLELAAECAAAGVDQLAAASVQFPPPDPGIEYAVYDDTGGRTRSQVLADFVAKLGGRLQQENVKLLVDVPVGAVMELPSLECYGTPGAYAVPLLVDSRPAVWGAGNAEAGLVNPVLSPYETTLTTLQNAIDKAGSAVLIPMVQAGTDAELPAESNQTYGPEQIAQQQRALEELGLQNYVMYHQGGEYTFSK